MAGWVRAPGGQAVYQDDSGVHLKDAYGDVQKVAPAEAAKLLGDKYSGFSAATADDLNAAHAEAEAAKSSKLGAAARHLAVGVAGGVLAPGKLVSGLATAGANALGANIEDPLRNISGRQVVNDLTAIGAHLTGGESEKAAREQREQLARDEAVHPYISGAAELAGNVIGSAPIAGGEAALAERGAQGVGLAGKAAQVGARVGASVLEGAGLGADAASEQAWVKNTPVTAEQTLAGIGLGALFGGAGAAAGEFAGPALRKLLKRGAAEDAGAEAAALSKGETLAEAGDAGQATALAPAAEEVAPAALERASDSLGSKARKWISGMGDDAAVSSIARGQQTALRNLAPGGGAPSKELLADAGKFLNESGIVGLGSDSAALERATAVKESAGQKIGAIMQRLDQDAPYVDGRPLVGKLDDMVSDLKQHAWLPEEMQAAQALEMRTEKVRQLAENGILSHSELQDYRISLDKLAKWSKRAAPTETQQAIRDARQVVEGELEKSIEQNGPALGQELGAEYKAAKRAYRFSSWAEDTLNTRVGIKDPANRLFSLTDYMGGLGALAATGGHALPALLLAGGNKLARERGMSTFAWLARKVAADSVDVAAAPAAAMRTAGAVRTMVTRAESHIQDGLGRYLGGETIGAVGGKARTTAAKAMRSAVVGDAKLAYRDHASEVQDLASNPQKLADRLQAITGTTLPTVAPGLHMAMAAVASRAANYLSTNLPAPPTDPDSITPQLDEAPPVSVADMRSYADRVEGVEDPLSLIDDLHENDVSPEKVDAVKTVWPELFQRMRQTTFDNLAQRTEKQGPVPYEQRKTLDLALDGNGALEPSLRADSLAVMKQTFQYQQQQLKQRAPRPSSGGSPKLGNMLATRSDQIASSR